jgi:NAD(P)-dependent dehydrogenase (short-subunit alcohol dehydrogenase family)
VTCSISTGRGTPPFLPVAIGRHVIELGLHGRVALVTGGSKGIGKASALGLAREGADVAICARGQELLERVAAEMAQQTGRSILPIVADLNREEDAQRFVHTAARHFGRLDILVNCAGSSPGGTLQHLSEQDWMLSLNLGDFRERPYYVRVGMRR